MSSRPEQRAGVADADLTGQTVLVTGSTSGIGREIALSLGRLGAHVIVHGRDRDRGRSVVDDLRDTDADGVTFITADFADLAAVREFAREIADRVDALDALVNNAGGYFHDARLTDDGTEYTLAVNHLAPFLLTHHLLPELSDDGRIVTTSSGAHRGGSVDFGSFETVDGYSGWTAYQQSKLANVLFTRELARRTDVTANCFHPGFVPGSAFMRHLPTPIRVPMRAVRFLPGVGTSVVDGASTGVYLAISPDVDGASGGYYANCERAEPSTAARDDATARRLWEVSEELTDLEASLRLTRPVEA
jgi:hypothetical protein